jgi:transposase
MLTLQLSEAEIALLNYERFYYPCAIVQKRLQAIYFKATQKLTNQEVGILCDLHHRTVSHWIYEYKRGGITAIYVLNYGTNTSILLTQKTTIIQDLEAHPVSSLKQAKARIETLTSIKRSPSSIRTFLKRHDFKFRKLGHIPAKADVEKQEQWLENDLNPQIELAKQGKIHLLFMDAAHFVLAPFICCVWSIVRLFIKAPAGRQRLNVIGTVNAISKEILFQWNTTYINAETLQDFLKFLMKKLPDKPLVLVLDNARYQHCKVVIELAKSLGITLLFLPPYSPNLNIIERLWKLIKKKVLYAKYYEKFADFQTAIIECLNRKDDEFIKESASLMTLKFQTFKNVSFYPV